MFTSSRRKNKGKGTIVRVTIDEIGNLLVPKKSTNSIFHAKYLVGAKFDSMRRSGCQTRPFLRSSTNPLNTIDKEEEFVYISFLGSNFHLSQSWLNAAESHLGTNLEPLTTTRLSLPLPTSATPTDRPRRMLGLS